VREGVQTRTRAHTHARTATAHPDFAWKAAYERLSPVVRVHAAALLVVFAYSVLAAEHAYKLDDALKQLAAGSPRRAENDCATRAMRVRRVLTLATRARTPWQQRPQHQFRIPPTARGRR